MGGTGRPGEDGGHGHRGTVTRAGRARGLLCEKYYLPLLQLAALLTGDAAVAEAVVADALASIPAAAATGWTDGDCLSYLQRQVIMRCRRAGRYHLSVPRKRHAASGFARLPVVIALLGLPASAREAVVLTHYLGLPAAEAATIAGISETLLTANLAAAMLVLDDHVTEPSPGS